MNTCYPQLIATPVDIPGCHFWGLWFEIMIGCIQLAWYNQEQIDINDI